MYKILILLLSFSFLSSCTAPLKKGAEFSQNKAYIIVGLSGNMPITEARNCNVLTCGTWHSLGVGEEQINGVHVFQENVGATFTLNTLHSNSNIVSFSGKIIKINKPGVYYFGLINSQDGKLLYTQEPKEFVLKKSVLKYGTKFSHLTPIDFSWPEI
jgi:hypothetical protein